MDSNFSNSITRHEHVEKHNSKTNTNGGKRQFKFPIPNTPHVANDPANARVLPIELYRPKNFLSANSDSHRPIGRARPIGCDTCVFVKIGVSLATS